MVVRTRVRVLTASLAAVCALSAAPALATSKHHRKRVGACNAHRRHAIKRTSKVIVYGKSTGTDEYSGGPLRTFYACLRPAGKSTAVGQNAGGGGEYPGNEAMSELSVAGTYVADVSSSGWGSAAACSKYEGNDPICNQQITWWIETVQASTRRRLKIDLSDGADALALSSAGAVAWLEPTTTSSGEVLQAMVLRRGGPGHLSGSVQTLDTGAIGSLRFNGLTLTWTNAGMGKSQTLG